MDPTAVLSQLKVKRGDLDNQETSLVHQIDEATRQLTDVRQTRDKVDESIAQFNNILSMIAQQWALPLGTSSAPVVVLATPEQAPVSTQAEAPKKPSKKAPATTKTFVVHEAPVPVPVPAPAPAPTPAPVPVVVSKEEAEPTQEEEVVEAEKETDGEGDVEVLEITQDGVTYVVFTDTNDVAEADDPDETIVGSWDPVSKKIVFA